MAVASVWLLSSPRLITLSSCCWKCCSICGNIMGGLVCWDHQTMLRVGEGPERGVSWPRSNLLYLPIQIPCGWSLRMWIFFKLSRCFFNSTSFKTHCLVDLLDRVVCKAVFLKEGSRTISWRCLDLGHSPHLSTLGTQRTDSHPVQPLNYLP